MSQQPTGIHHIAIMAADIKKHIAFFAEVLGFPLVALFDMHGVPGGLHAFLRMAHAESGELAATYEILGLHVDMASHRAAPFPEPARARIGALAAVHASHPRPPEAGRGIALRPRN